MAVSKKWQINSKYCSIIFVKIIKKKIIIYGAGRTDSGVHAIEQSAHFYYKEKLTNIPKLIKSLNFFLNKKEISILIIKKKKYKFSC